MNRFFNQLSKRVPPVIWHTLTGVLLASSLCLCGFFTLIFFNPQTAFNPLRPPTRTPLPTGAPATAVPAGQAQGAPTLPPAWTPTPLGTQPTRAATNTAVPAATAAAPKVLTPTLAASATPPAAPTQAAPPPTAAATATPGGSATPSLTPTSGASATPATPTATLNTGYPGPGPGLTTTPAAGYP